METKDEHVRLACTTGYLLLHCLDPDLDFAHVAAVPPADRQRGLDNCMHIVFVRELDHLSTIFVLHTDAAPTKHELGLDTIFDFLQRGITLGDHDILCGRVVMRFETNLAHLVRR